jgi:CheY-like chemotaxis protein
MLKLLFVDDDPEGAEPVCLYLRHHGFEVVVARNGSEALNLLTDGAGPDLILLDVRMPRMDGLEFLTVLRSYHRWQTVPVILLTAYADIPMIAREADRHHAHLMSKAGINLSELVKVIEQRSAPVLPGQGATGSHFHTSD